MPAAETIRPEVVSRLRDRIRTAWLSNLLRFADLPDDAQPSLEEVLKAVALEWGRALEYAPPKPRPKKPRQPPRWLAEARRRLAERDGR